MVKISIIVPVYNTSKYLEKCARSILSQTLSDIEIIFVDDGSTDDSLAVLKNLDDARVKVLTQKHQGQSVARNLGLMHATGEFIGFVDSDDWVKPEMFEKLYQSATSQNAQISMCSFVTPDPYMNVDLFEAPAFSPTDTFPYIFRICVQPCNKIYSKKLLEGIQFTPGLAFEDNLFFFQTYLKAKKISVVNEPLYFYHRHSSSVSNNKEKMKDIAPVLSLVEDYLKSTPYWEDLRENFYKHKENTLNYWSKKSELLTAAALEPKISVITICKNEVESIEKTLLSVFSQTYKNYEVIVIDGVSTDGTLDVIKKYEDKIAHFVSEKDNGIYSAMNKGISRATGDLFYFLNANDSVVSDDIFAKVVDAFAANPNAELLFGDFNYIKDGKFNRKTDFLKNYNDYWLFKKTSLCHQTVFYKRELFEKYGKYNEKFVIAGDTERNVNFLIKNKVLGLYLPITMANYSLGGISGDLKNLKKCNSEERKILRKYYGIFSCFIKKLWDYMKFFFPKFFVKINAKHNVEKMNVIKLTVPNFSD